MLACASCIPGPDVAALPVSCRLAVQQELELQTVAIRIIRLGRPGYHCSDVLGAGGSGCQAGHDGCLVGRLLRLLGLLPLLLFGGLVAAKGRHSLLSRLLNLRSIQAKVDDLLVVSPLWLAVVIIADPDADLIVSGIANGRQPVPGAVRRPAGGLLPLICSGWTIQQELVENSVPFWILGFRRPFYCSPGILGAGLVALQCADCRQHIVHCRNALLIESLIESAQALLPRRLRQGS